MFCVAEKRRLGSYSPTSSSDDMSSRKTEENFKNARRLAADNIRGQRKRLSTCTHKNIEDYRHSIFRSHTHSLTDFVDSHVNHLVRTTMLNKQSLNPSEVPCLDQCEPCFSVHKVKRLCHQLVTDRLDAATDLFEEILSNKINEQERTLKTMSDVKNEDEPMYIS